MNSSINLYKTNLIKFINSQNYKIIKVDQINEIDYIIGIFFLTEMNRNCKNNKINIHGYYISYTFINIFKKIINIIINNKNTFSILDINHFWLSLNKNIDYLNLRDCNNNIKNKINYNFSKLTIEITPFLNKIMCFDTKNNDNSSYLELLSNFFYILLLIAGYMGSGIYNNPSLVRLSDYYSNIFITYFKFNSYNIYDKQNIYENYINYVNKLNYSLIELKLNSTTLDEILKFIDKNIKF